MRTRRGWRRGLALGLVAGLVLAGALRGESIPKGGGDKDLRKRALELNEITGSGPLAGKLKEMRASPAKTLQLLKVAARMAKEKEQPFNRNATMLLAMAAESAREVDMSARFYRLNAEQSLKLLSEKGLAMAYLGLVQVYKNNRRYADCEKVCKEFLAIELEEDGPVERLKPMVLRQLVTVIARQGSTDKALKMAEQMIEDDPRNFLNRALKAQIEREAEKFEDAAKTYLDVIDRVKKDRRLEKEHKDEYVDEYRYLLSAVYVDLKQIDKAAEQLKLLLEREPDNPTYNNDLGFIWADNGKNLKEAEKLIRKAIDEDRKLRKKADPDFKPGLETDNSAYLDSLGWVLFKLGKTKEAKPYLLQAVKDKEGQSLEVYDHLGDVHRALGEKKEAVAAWKRGLEVATTSKRDVKRKAEVQKKLKKDTEEK
jgi:tetratricopeptide (TPR) repeat protein